MAETDAQKATRLKNITNALEASYQSMRLAAANIASLVTSGRATCAEVKAYNIGALALYHTQIGMLNTLRAEGKEEGLPQLPPQPTVFVWKGVTGANALSFDCSRVDESQGMAGALHAAMNDPEPTYLPADKIEVSTQDLYAFDPMASPTFKTLFETQALQQQQPAAQGELGLTVIAWIVIAGFSISVGVALVNAIMKYLETSAIQEANTEQVRLQAAAFATYTAARLDCFKDCTTRGGSNADCTKTCGKLVTQPKITLPGALNGKWGALQWVGFVTVSTFGVWLAYRLYLRKKETGRILPQVDFSLPEGV
jgi:hypothetical protein